MPRLRPATLALLLASLLPACTNEGAAADDAPCETGCEESGEATGGDDGDETAGLDDGSGDGEPGGPAVPCEIQTLAREHCGECHAESPRYGAPMPLVSYDDFHVPAKSDPSRSVWELSIARMNDPVSPMPPAGSEHDHTNDHVLREWLEAGAPAADEGEQCGDAPIDPEEPVGPDALPCTPTQVFTAFGDTADEPFHVPSQGADDLYQCFTFHSPVAEGEQAIAWAPIIDDERVVHHWILYRTNTPQPDGGSGICNMPGDAKFVAGWAPGGQNFMMPDDVGLEIGGPDVYYILQLHYHNTANHADSFDRSGVAFCTVDEPRPQLAGMITLGTVFLDIPPGAEDHEESGVCPSWITSFMPEPLTVIASFPHMHELGRAFTTEILRGGSEADIDMITDVPIYDFQSQTFYVNDPPVQILPGDALRTTCTYDNPTDQPVHFGEATSEEMCLNFIMAYPIDTIGENRDCGILDDADAG
jgi:Copper type II ascorbate-dependent monooxygenase, C-terminal domain/Copper type II ascorbate-dependent monooxygenase, N-terminal domain